MTLYVRLDAEYASDDEFIEAGPMAELLYIRALCFCKRKLIDGVISSKQLPAVALGIPNPKRHANALVEVGLWAATDDGWMIADWLKWNKSADEIETERLLAKEAGERGNHERWHIGEDGKPSPKCRLCRRDRIGYPDRVGDGVSMGEPKRGRSPKEKPEPEPEEKPEPEPEPEPIPRTTSLSSKLVAGEPPTRRTRIVETIVDLRAEASQAKGKLIGNRSAWAKTVRCEVESHHGPKLDQWLQQFPDAPADVIAGALESGDARALVYYQPTHTPTAPTERLTREQRDAVIAQAKETA